MIDLSVLYDLTDAIRDGLRIGDAYRDEAGDRQVLDEDRWREYAPLDLQVLAGTTDVRIYF